MKITTISTAIVLLAAGFSALAFASDAKCSAAAEAVPLCTVLADTSKYEGKDITVRGLYRKESHGAFLTSPECDQTHVNLHNAWEYKADKQAAATVKPLSKKKNRSQTLDMVLRGTFKVAHQGQCMGPDCLAYEIENRQLLCAEPIEMPAAEKTDDSKQ